MDTQAKRIISKFGGIHPLSRALGHKNPSTVQGWIERGFIPPRQHHNVWEAAQRSGVLIELSDFAAVAVSNSPEAA